jgi:nicotinamidase-related amidase
VNVIPFGQRQPVASSPLVIFADLQLEYVAAGRALAVDNVEPCLSNCRLLLDTARGLRLPIAHARQLRADVYFNRHSPFTDWIDSFRPRASEMVYERRLPSLYDNPDFAAFLSHMPDPTLILAGLTADQACLATAVEAHHRRHRVIFLGDCSATAALGALPEPASHEAVCTVISRYADVLTLDEFLARLAQPREVNWINR